jgi:pimeloyl-ACP methyl ester carboxylesterase
MNIKATVLSFLVLTEVLATGAIAQNPASSDYKTLPVNGITMAYRDIGSGPALILLHGFSGTGTNWDPFLEDLSTKSRLIVPDLRGHGRTLNPSGQFTHQELAQDVFSLLDQLGIDSFSAIGTSMGAMTLLHAATLQRERINAMVLVGGSSYLPESARVIYRRSSPDSIPPERLKRMASRHSGGEEQALQLMRQFYSYRDSYDDVNFTKPYLSSIKTSTLIVQGDRDQFFPVPIALEMYNAIPNAYLWVVPNSGHSAGLRTTEGRKIFTDTVLDFLDGNWEQ